MCADITTIHGSSSGSIPVVCMLPLTTIPGPVEFGNLRDSLCSQLFHIFWHLVYSKLLIHWLRVIIFRRTRRWLQHAFQVVIVTLSTSFFMFSFIVSRLHILEFTIWTLLFPFLKSLRLQRLSHEQAFALYRIIKIASKLKLLFHSIKVTEREPTFIVLIYATFLKSRLVLIFINIVFNYGFII